MTSIEERMKIKEEFTSQEVFEWFQKQGFQKEQGEQEYTMIYEIDLPRIINKFLQDHGNSAREKEEGWVSVKERTPDFDGRYLCFIEAPQECGNIWRFQETVDLHFNEWITSEDQYVTHWRPLPPNP